MQTGGGIIPFSAVAESFEKSPELYRDDGIHLNDDGKKKLAQVFAAKIAEMESAMD